MKNRSSKEENIIINIKILLNTIKLLKIEYFAGDFEPNFAELLINCFV